MHNLQRCTGSLTNSCSFIAEKEKWRFFTNITDLPLRPTAILAKAAATLDILTNGRFELGISVGC
jgi:alkanesulfonate monooxygenase SsuD/methylene tetrahydromethanopterin reductase-like flavin-dependent oxidoreductase (luciferase family)